MLLRDILKGGDEQIEAVIRIIARNAPDILVLQRVDYDYHLHALAALRDALSVAGVDYPHIFALRPNSGQQTGLDMDGDGRSGEARDAQGYGEFAGQGGMAVLSRFPIAADQVQDFSDKLWQDMPDALLPEVDGVPFPSPQAIAIQKLSSVGHWVVPVIIGDKKLDLMLFHASPPVFDGPEDRNGKRNHDEVLFWQHYLDGRIGTVSGNSFAVVGGANLDPADSDGRREAITTLLTDGRLQDPRPARPGSVVQQTGHKGDPRLDTANWPAPGPGALRVDYILPAADLLVTGSGIYWPEDGSEDAELARVASRHRLVWVDLELEHTP